MIQNCRKKRIRSLSDFCEFFSHIRHQSLSKSVKTIKIVLKSVHHHFYHHMSSWSIHHCLLRHHIRNFIIIIIVLILVIYHPGENQLMSGNRLVGALSSVCGRKLQEIPEFAPTMNCNQPYKTSHTTKHTTVNNRPTIQYRENNQCNDATVKNQRHSESTYER